MGAGSGIFQPKIKIAAFFRITGSVERCYSRIWDGTGRQAPPLIGIIGMINFQIFVQQPIGMRFMLYFGKDVFNGGAGLESHPDFKPIGKNTGNLYRFFRHPVFPLNNTRQNNGIIPLSRIGWKMRNSGGLGKKIIKQRCYNPLRRFIIWEKVSIRK